MARIARKDILKRLRGMVRRGEPIIGGGAGTGLSAKCEEAGGIDLIVIYNSGRYRMAGRGSLAGLLAYGNANEIVLDMAREVLPVVKHTPVLAGVNGTDPFLLRRPVPEAPRRPGLLRHPELPDRRAVRRHDPGPARGNRHGLRASRSQIVERARQLDLLTTPYVFSEQNARDMAKAGADIVVCHLGLTTGGAIGAQHRADARGLRAADRRLGGGRARGQPRRHRAVPRRADRDAGGRALHPARTAAGCNGFYGASSMERLPTETALTETTRTFKRIDIGRRTRHDRSPIRTIHPRP